MVIPPEVSGLLLLAVAAAAAGGQPARLVGGGILLVAFGAASARVALSVPPDAPLALLRLTGLAAESRAIDGGLVVAGLLAISGGLPGVLRMRSAARRWTAVLLLLGGLVTTADATVDLIRVAPWMELLLAAAAMIAAGAALLLVRASGRLARLPARLRALFGSPEFGRSADRTGRLWLVLAAAGTLMAIGAPHALLIMAGAGLASIGLHLAMHRRRLVSIVPLLPAAVLPLLFFEAHYLRVIAGPVGLAARNYAVVPLSMAAQIALAPPLIIAAGLLAGPLPLRRWLPGSALAIVSVALLLRLAHPLLGSAMPGWETLFVPMALALFWVAALAGDWGASAGMAAWLVALIVAPGAAEGAWCLGVAALALGLARQWPASRALSAGLRISAAAGGSAGAALGSAALLQHQVVYGVAAVLAALVLVFRTGNIEPMIYSAGSRDLTAHSGDAHGIHASSSPI